MRTPAAWLRGVRHPEAFHGDGVRGGFFEGWYVTSNHLDATTGDGSDASLIASVAIIPWLRGSFRGSIVGLRHGGRLYRWTTYNRARERRLEIDDTRVRWEVEGPDGVLELDAKRVRGGLLHAPLRTAMHRRVEETLDARVRFRHVSSRGGVQLAGVAECAGLEVFGDIDRLLALRT